MNVAEEYKSIRDEMLQRFGWTFHLVFFSLASTAALLSWLSTQTSEAQSNTSLSPFLFACIGLAITGYLFYTYRELLRSIYNQGSYIAVFHEGRKEGPNYHRLSRFSAQLLGEKPDWGRDGRRGAYLVAVLVFANIFGPLWLLKENLDFCGLNVLFFIAMIVLLLLLARIGWGLFTTAKFMRQNLEGWLKIKQRLEEEPDLLSDVVDLYLQKEESSAEEKPTPR